MEATSKTEKIFAAGCFTLLLIMAAGFVANQATGSMIAGEVALAAIMAVTAWVVAFMIAADIKSRRK